MSLARQLPAFLFVGAITVVIDAAVYAGAISLGVSVAVAKTVGFLCGTLIAYCANRHVTFAGTHRACAPLRFALVYAASLQLNVGVNGLVLHGFAGRSADATIAFLLATACSATLNFVGMKLFVFTAPAPVAR